VKGIVDTDALREIQPVCLWIDDFCDPKWSFKFLVQLLFGTNGPNVACIEHNEVVYRKLGLFVLAVVKFCLIGLCLRQFGSNVFLDLDHLSDKMLMVRHVPFWRGERLLAAMRVPTCVSDERGDFR